MSGDTEQLLKQEVMGQLQDPIKDMERAGQDRDIMSMDEDSYYIKG